MSATRYPAQSFEAMSRRQAITTCYALEDMRDQALAAGRGVEEQLDRANAAITRVLVLIGDPASPDDAWGTHSEKCYGWHAGCLAVAIRAALKEPK